MNNEIKRLDQKHIRIRIIAIGSSFLVSLVLLAVKFQAYRLTQSSAILSDALESIINVVASAFALGSIVVASRPPDESHPYGHGKIEYFSAGFEGALIMLAAVGIFRTGYAHILHPVELPNLDSGLLLLLAAGLINLVLGIGLVRAGRQTHSITLIADGRHVLTDVYTSGGVLLGLILVHFTGWYWLDGTIACLVGVHVLISGTQLIRQSFAGLMDTSDPELLDEIAAILVRERKNIWIDVHELRAWRSGSRVHIDFHLVLPRDLTLEEAHREAGELEEIIQRHFQHPVSVLIHMDPCVGDDCPVCTQSVCRYREHKSRGPAAWSREYLTFFESE